MMASRSDPVMALSRWVGEALEGRVVGTRRLFGGISSLVVRVELADGRVVVAREIRDEAWLEREPGLIAREACALQVAEGCSLHTPTHLADDGRSRLAMSLVPGLMGPDQQSLRARASRLGAAASAIADTPLPADHGLANWRPWFDDQVRPPSWGDVGLWNEAISAWFDAPPAPSEAPVLLHRDLHPLNVLWSKLHISSDPIDGIAVVDWINACVGHPQAELGHCRWNLAILAGPDAVEAFTEAARRAGPTAEARAPYDTRWDLASNLSFITNEDGIGVDGWHDVGRLDLVPEVVLERTEAFLRRALVNL